MFSHSSLRIRRSTRFNSLFLTLAVSAVSLGAVHSAEAAPVKDSCQVKKNSSGTIQQAIDSGCTAIRVFPGTYTENLIIPSGNVSITAVSNGKNTVIDGGANGSVVRVGSAAQVTLTGLTIQNGNMPIGGGIYNLGSVSLINTTVENNFSSYGGAGIFNQFGTVTLSNSLITNNTAVSVGGGIFNNEGTVTIDNSSVTNNEAGFQGGGIFNNKGFLSLIDSAVTGNVAGLNGGGISNLQGEYELLGSTVVADNSPDDIAGD
ncbi:MAG: hypothetical protein V4671_07435 [Armatimonadota bacterium]